LAQALWLRMPRTHPGLSTAIGTDGRVALPSGHQPRDQHLADGYASDDDHRPRRAARGFGALPGDEGPRCKLTQEQVLDYEVRQASSGPSTAKVRFSDAFKGIGRRPAPAETKPRTAFQQHHALLGLLCRPRGAEPILKSDFDLLRENHRFLRTEEDDDGSWEAQLAKRYYDRLFREYVVCDLAGYRKGHIGFRWRTESEVVRGKGQFHCGHKPCDSRLGLRSYEVDFKYSEAGARKRALVKVRLCERCAYKLHYRHLRSARKRRQREARSEQKRARRSGSPATDGADSCSELDAGEGSKKDSKVSPVARGLKENISPGQLKEEERRLLESMAWKGTDPKAQSRQDDFDEYLQGLLP